MIKTHQYVLRGCTMNILYLLFQMRRNKIWTSVARKSVVYWISSICRHLISRMVSLALYVPLSSTFNILENLVDYYIIYFAPLSPIFSFLWHILPPYQISFLLPSFYSDTLSTFFLSSDLARFKPATVQSTLFFFNEIRLSHVLKNCTLCVIQ